MKSVQIPYDLFVDLVLYHLNGEDDFDEEIRQGLEQKLDAILNRQLYSHTNRSHRRRTGTGKAGVSCPPWSAAELSLDDSSLGAVTGACHAPVAGRQGKALADTAPRIPVPIEKSAEFEMDGERISQIFSACGRQRCSKFDC